MTYADRCDIDNETLKAAEEKYIKHYDSLNKGLNARLRIGKICSHKKRRETCIQCGGSSLCLACIKIYNGLVQYAHPKFVNIAKRVMLEKVI